MMMDINMIARALTSLTINEHDEVARILVMLDECQAERLKNAIAFQQQERDDAMIREMETMERSYDNDSIDYGVRA